MAEGEPEHNTPWQPGFRGIKVALDTCFAQEYMFDYCISCSEYIEPASRVVAQHLCIKQIRFVVKFWSEQEAIE